MRSNAWQDSVKNVAERLRVKFYSKAFQPGRHLKRFPVGAPLEEVGGVRSVATPLLKPRLFIDVQFAEHAVSSVPVELIPKLVIGSSYLNKERISNQQIQYRRFTVRHCDFFRDSSGNNWCSLFDEQGFPHHVRQLELARTLFLHNAHLARTAFRPNGLRGLASIEKGDELTHIRFGLLSDYRATNLRTKAVRAHLSWLLLDQEARKSFGSIYDCWAKGEPEPWTFEFSPPDLQGWQVSVGGWFVGSIGEERFVGQELVSLHNPSFRVATKVKFSHPLLADRLPVELPGGKRPEVDPVDTNPELNLWGLPRIGRRVDRVTDHRFAFTFGEEPKTELDFDKQTHHVTPRVNPDKTPRPEEASVGHAEERGNAQELDYGINRPADEPEKAPELVQAEPTDRFRLFKRAVAELQKKPDYQVDEIDCYQLPTPRRKRQKALRTKTGRPLLFHLAVLRYRDLPLVIVEVDTENLKKPHTLSTLVAGFSSDPTEGLREIMQACSDQRVKWDKAVINKHCSTRRFCKHPNRGKRIDDDKRKRLRTAEEYRQAWVAILEKRIVQVYQDVIADRAVDSRGGNLSPGQ